MPGFFDRLPLNGYICAHRGARSLAPENTLLALELARQRGAHLWETDVQMTADEQLVLFHDRTLSRTTNISSHDHFKGRRRWPLSRFSLEELQQLDAGSWFLETDPFATVAGKDISDDILTLIPGQKIFLLQSALEYCRKHDFPVNLEIKGKLPPALRRRRIEVLLQLMQELDCEDLVLISSFEHDNLRLIKQLQPALATAALVERHHPRNLLNYLKDLQVEAYHPAQEIADAEGIALLTQAGIRVNTWTVNEPQRFQYFRDAGTTFICTDWPQRMVMACGN